MAHHWKQGDLFIGPGNGTKVHVVKSVDPYCDYGHGVRAYCGPEQKPGVRVVEVTDPSALCKKCARSAPAR